MGATYPASATKPENVLVVVNQASPLSRKIAEYYVQRRAIPKNHVCLIQAPTTERINRADYDNLRAGVGRCLTSKGLAERILYIVTTQGVPLAIHGKSGQEGDAASVDSELTLLYAVLKGETYTIPGALRNPFFMQRDVPFSHARFPIYLVTRLAGYDFADVKGLIDRSLLAKNSGRVVLDARATDDGEGDVWLRRTAFLLPDSRVLLEDTKTPAYDKKDVIGFASWGSNDPARKRRRVGFTWLPGAIATEFVSTNGRTFEKPPDSWNLGNWKDRSTHFANSPQTLTADYIADGATGASGHTSEPYLAFTPRPDFLFPAYLSGRNLAESYWMSIRAVSWQNIVIGDPLCSLGVPAGKQ